MEMPPATGVRDIQTSSSRVSPIPACSSVYDVELDGTVEASAAALTGSGHLMYWLAAQSAIGRRAELGYLVLAALISDAYAAGISAVNLGASEGLPGVAHFKSRFGGVDGSVLEDRVAVYPVLLRRSTRS